MSKSYTPHPRPSLGILLILGALAACGKGGGPSAASQSGAGASGVIANTPQDQGRHLRGGDDSTPPPGPPVAGTPPPATPAPFHPGPRWSAAEQARFATVRVKIFPHNGTYKTPEGAEKVKDSITFTEPSPGICSVFAAKGASATGSYDEKATALSAGPLIALSAKTLTQPVWVVCDAPPTLLREGAKTEPMRYAGKFFVKKVTLAGSAAYLTVVNELPLEEYVKGVVPSEMPNSWPLEALKAQAVAARSYAMFSLAIHDGAHDPAIEREKSGADLDDTVGFQAYLGQSTAGPTSDQAVQETAGQVLTYEGTLVNAYFHADSGGHTEDAANVWGEVVPYAVGKAELFPASKTPDSRWAVSEALSSLESHFPATLKGAAPAGLSVNSDELYASGRARLVNIDTAAGPLRVSAASLASALNLHSTLFRFGAPSGGVVKIRGAGFGHGVGMNQDGAKVLAESYRKTYDEILKFYYTGVEIFSGH